MSVQPFSIPVSSSLRARVRWVGAALVLTLLILGAGRASARVASTPERPTAPQAPAVTVVDDDIVEDTVWTRAGSPYQVAFVSSGILVSDGVTLTVDPGVEVRFAQNASLIVEGTIKAIGTATQPITITGTTKQPGWWLFLVIQGDLLARNQGSVFRHVTIEYAQWNLMLTSATAHLSDCVLQNASEVGLWGMDAEGTVVERCRIVGNGVSGIENALGGVMLAANNWWGSATGPTHEDCNPAGTGDTVDDFYSQGVAFRPFLTAPDQEVPPVTVSQALNLTLAPQRWFAPADGLTLIPVELTLRDGAGRPLAGRKVQLYSDLGTAGGSAVTGADGKALTYVTSDAPGDATLWALVEDSSACEIASSAEAVVSFVETPDDPLLPGSEAPYMNGAIDIDPKPITQGVPSTVSVRLSNPNAFPILVDVVLGYAQFSIGVSFAPLGGAEDVRIEANSERVISVAWTPPESGHVCLRATYDYGPVGMATLGAQAASGGGQTNFRIEPGPLGDPGPDDGAPPDDEEDPDDDDPESKPQMAQRAKAAMDRINDGQMVLDAVSSPENIPGLAIPNALFSAIMDFNLESWTKAR
ncbi:MAG: Ig-like domain-containing protein [Anaerolineae bacterium]|nr:Ig-like domain-containing protein [Anaerolineae bacterium]